MLYLFPGSNPENVYEYSFFPIPLVIDDVENFSPRSTTISATLVKTVVVKIVSFTLVDLFVELKTQAKHIYACDPWSRSLGLHLITVTLGF